MAIEEYNGQVRTDRTDTVTMSGMFVRGQGDSEKNNQLNLPNNSFNRTAITDFSSTLPSLVKELRDQVRRQEKCHTPKNRACKRR